MTELSDYQRLVEKPHTEALEATIAKQREAIKSLSAKLEKAREAIKTADSWMEHWATHVGNCAGGQSCTCGATRVAYELAEALKEMDQ